MDDQVREALKAGHTIDITTTGRSSGKPQRIEIRFHNVDGTVYISGSPGKRSWYANLLANPAFTFHLKRNVVVDLPARATPITDPAVRRAVFTRILVQRSAPADLEAWMAGSRLVEVSFEHE